MGKTRDRPLPPLAAGVKYYRELAGLTQPQLKELSGATGVGVIEAGRTGAREETLQAISDVLSSRLGYQIAPHDLRAGEPDEARRQTLQSLREFLDSPLAADVTDEEREALFRATWPKAHVPTMQSWSLAIASHRSARPAKP